LAACVFIALTIWAQSRPVQIVKDDSIEQGRPPVDPTNPSPPPPTRPRWTDDARDGMQPRQRPDAPALATMQSGTTLPTKAGERRLVQLDEGSRVYVNEKTEITANATRQLTLTKGQIYLEVAPRDDGPRFTVKSGDREITATGTHFAVGPDASVLVTQGKVT